MSGFLLIIIVGVLGALVQWRLNSVMKKYSKVLSPGGLTGSEVAQRMLMDHQIYDVSISSVPGELTDHYNPQKKSVNISQGVYNSNSVAALAVAAHECGHAVQHAQGYAPLKLRSKLVPVVQISSTFSQIVIIAGILLVEVFPLIFWLGIAMFAMVLLFSVITLPVEYNASHRALAWLGSTNSMTSEELSQAKVALKWAARTYLVAALSALATLVYYLGFRDRD